ncbi:site-specific integrase [Gramella sp. BOM4]|nr:site-specific integrase [Christiangramia bathymodioli]
MKKKEQIKVVHRNGHDTVEIFVAKKRYSDPKLFIPRRYGKPVVGPGDYWYIYFYWRSDPEGPLDTPFKFKNNINYLKTAKERKAAGKIMCAQYKKALEMNWNPETKTVGNRNRRKEIVTLKDGLQYAFDIKKKGKKQPTIDGYKFHLDRFMAWSDKHGYSGMNVKHFSIDHFYEFWDWIRFEYVQDEKKPLSGTSINNHKRSISALFTTMKKERLIKDNFIIGVPLEDEDPVNNKAFSRQQLIDIKEQLEKNDPYLIPILQFILYPILRPREVFTLQISDLNTEDWLLTVETKTERLSKRRIIDKLKPTIQDLHLKGKPGHYHVFTYENKPGVWNPKKLKSKVDHFGRRFAEAAKEPLGMGREYGLYSARHTAIMDLYYTMVNSGMAEYDIYIQLMQYTLHKTIDGVKKYIRQHQDVLPPDHSDLYSIDF